MRSGIIAASYMRGEPFVMQAINLQGNFTFSLRFIGTVKVDWGDGTTSKITSSISTSPRAFPHTYSAPYTGPIRVIGNNNIVYFTSAAQTGFTGELEIPYTEFNKLKNLVYLHVARGYISILGDGSDMLLPNLQEWYGGINGYINPLNTTLRILDHSSGYTLEQVPDELVNLETFYARGIYMGTYVPETYTKLTTLAVITGNKLADIPEVSTLVTIDIRGQSANQNTISAIPDGLPDLESIRVEGNNTIPTLPSVVESPKVSTIYLTGLNTVTSVPAYPLLVNLTLRSVYNIVTSIAEYPLLRSLDITELNVATLPHYPVLRAMIIQKSAITSFGDNEFTDIGTSANNFQLNDNTGLVWDIADFKGRVQFFRINNVGGNITYSGGMNFPTVISTMQVNANLSSSEVDLFFNEIDASGAASLMSGTSVIRFQGEAAAPTSASSTARANLAAKGFNIFHN